MSFCPAHGFFIGTSCTLCRINGPLRICPKHDWNMGTYCAACRDEALTAYRSAFAGIDLAKGKDWTGVKVMKAPTEQQLRDPAWWRANDPSGGNATHFDGGATDISSDWPRPWLRLAPAGWQEWSDELRDWVGLVKTAHFVERPTKPEPQERESEIVSRIGELGNQVHNLGCDWQNDEFISEDLGMIAVKLWDLEKKARAQAKEQREREELVREAAHAIEMKNGSPITLYIKYCEDLYDAGLLCKGAQ